MSLEENANPPSGEPDWVRDPDVVDRGQTSGRRTSVLGQDAGSSARQRNFLALAADEWPSEQLEGHRLRLLTAVAKAERALSANEKPPNLGGRKPRSDDEIAATLLRLGEAERRASVRTKDPDPTAAAVAAELNVTERTVWAWRRLRRERDGAVGAY